MPRKTQTSASNETEFGTSVRKVLTEYHVTQRAAADSIGVSQPYFNQMMTGAKKPAPEWVDIIATTLSLNERERKKLHRAAARDMGFKL